MYYVPPYTGTPASSESVYAVQIPSDPGSDGVDRSTFVRASIAITAPGGLGVATAKVYFGYTEQGLSTDYYCTSRREACVAVGSTVTDATPFSYATTESYSPAACSVSCTIAIPVLPLHTAYFKISYLNGGGAEVASDLGVAVESTYTINGPPPPSSVSSSISGKVTISGKVVLH